MNPVFNTNPAFLSAKLLHPDRPRIGAITYLNVNVLPDFIEYIKKNLTPEELISLSDYQLQTYIMQLSIKQKITDTLDNIVQKIITHMRTKKEFWINGKVVKNQENQEKQNQEKKHQHEAIIQYQRDIQFINEKIPNYPQKVFNNYKKRRIQPYLQVFATEYMDKSKQALKIIFTNYAMMPSFVLYAYLEQKAEKNNFLKDQILPRQQEQLLHILQNGVQYFLIGQRPHSSCKKQAVKTRELVRKRNVPSYLQNRQVLNPQIILQEQFQPAFQQRQSQISNFNVEYGSKKVQNEQNPIQTQNRKYQQLCQQSAEEESEQQNQFYHKFQETVSKKDFYDSKMFNRLLTINQSHNVLQILKCLVYLINQEQEIWFQKTWRELQQQKILRQKKRKQQEQQNSENEQQDREISQRKSANQHDKDQQPHQNMQKYQQNDPTIRNQDEIPMIKPIMLQKHQHQNWQNFQKPVTVELSKQLMQSRRQTIQSHKQTQIGLNNRNPQEERIIVQMEQNNLRYPIEQKIQLQQQSFQSHRELHEQVPAELQIGVRKPIFDSAWKNPTNLSFTKLTKNLEAKFLTIRETYFVAKEYIKRHIMAKFNDQKRQMIRLQTKSVSLQDALVNPSVSFQEIYFQFKEMIEHPENVKLGAFKTEGITIPWEETEYLLFLKGLLEFFFIPTNNRRIASDMMSKSSKKNVEANHVKYVKAIYLKNMQIRIERGQSGGGKKGKNMGKIEFLQKDIEFFSMRWFDKINKSKKKKNRRRTFEDDNDAAEQVDSAY